MRLSLFDAQYEIAESTEYYDVSLGFVKTKGMNWPVRRPIVYRDSIIELRYTFRVDGVYLLFRVGDFSKEIFRRQWFVEEVRLLGRPDLAFQQVGVLPGPFIVELFDGSVRSYPAGDSYDSELVVCTPEAIFRPVVSFLSSDEMIRIYFLVRRCWLTLLIEEVLLERGVELGTLVSGL